MPVFPASSGPVKFCRFSPDVCLVASSSCDHTVRLWDVTRFKCLHVLRGKRADLLRLFCGLCHVLFPTFRLVSAGHQRSVETVSFSPDSRQLASGGWDRRVILWEVQV